MQKLRGDLQSKEKNTEKAHYVFMFLDDYAIQVNLNLCTNIHIWLQNQTFFSSISICKQFKHPVSLQLTMID